MGQGHSDGMSDKNTSSGLKRVVCVHIDCVQKMAQLRKNGAHGR